MKIERLEKDGRGRIVAFLTREEIDFIDKIAKDALFSTGHKLSRTEIIRAFIDAVKIKDVSGDGVHSKDDLERRLLAIMNMTLPHTLSKLKEKKRHLDENI